MMNRFQPKQVIVTSLTLALLLSGTALYTTKQRAYAETPDQAVKPYTSSEHTKVSQGKVTKEHTTGRDFAKGKMPILEEASAVLGMNSTSLSSSLKNKNLVEIANEKGISETDLIVKLLTERAKKIDEAVLAGKIKTENADKLKSNMADHLKFMVNHTGEVMKHGANKADKKQHNRMLPAPDKLAAILGITSDELNAEMKAGKSLTQIAEAKGISKEQLIKHITEQITPWVEKTVDHKWGQTPAKQQPAS
ncbi:hypothetical protein SAMN03159341_106331 [Paenibacillus sp. 1_12]|uniref:hypothetical protein n=1 Tax=Paenibacillus sp. 1_12 TaxID=1566278 RepID=UPI0008DF41EA|nr:hypothetical protein [Paenibacillus sp. 1_12]SFL49075.1 hypothetical protein SAMN03159341_106331 [Paenibacillus sp. 1_12]